MPDPKPPKGYKLSTESSSKNPNAKPPAGYILPTTETAPAFIRDSVDMSKVHQVVGKPQTQEEQRALADVSNEDPYKVNVFHPELYKAPQRDHELTHVFQDTRNKNITPSADTIGGGKDSYSYGGKDGLEKARLSGKTIAHFNAEQQAEIVKDYKTEHDKYLALAASGKMTEHDKRDMYNLQQTYHPFIKQLADMPSDKTNLDQNALKLLLGMQKDPKINADPSAPGLPNFAVKGLGVVPADPLMGGSSVSTRR